MAFVKQLDINGTKYDIKAQYDGAGDTITTKYATTIDFDTNTISLKNASSQEIDTAIIPYAQTNSPGLMSALDKAKLDAFYVASEYATTSFVEDLVEANNAMVYKGVVNSNSDLPASPENGWTYKVGTAGTYSGLSCQIGDLLMYNGNQSKWEKISSSIQGALYQSGNYTDNYILLADGTQGAVKSVAVAPSVALSTANASNGQTLTLTVGGISGAASASLAKATTGVWGVTKLTNSISTSTTTAATPNTVKSAYDLASKAIPKSIGTTAGDIIYWSNDSTPVRLGKGSDGQVLKLVSGVPAWATDNNTQNTTGSTDISTKIFLIGASTQATSPQTYSDNQVYATNGQLDANKVRVAEQVTLQYNSTTKSLDFIFA